MAAAAPTPTTSAGYVDPTQGAISGSVLPEYKVGVTQEAAAGAASVILIKLY